MPLVGPTAKAPSMSRCACLISSSSAFTRSAGRAAISACAASSFCTPSSAANCSAYSALTSGVPTMPLAGLSEIACAKRPFAAGTASSVATACAPALSPKIVTLSGVTTEHRDVVTHPAQRHHKVPQEQVVLDRDVAGRQRRQVEAAQRADPVVHRDVHTTLAGQRRTVVDRRRRAAEDVAAAVDEHHHRHRFVTASSSAW